MRRLWTEPVVDFTGNGSNSRLADWIRSPCRNRMYRLSWAATRTRPSAARRAPAGTKKIVDRLDAILGNAGRKRGEEFEIIVTPPTAMPIDLMRQYVKVGVDRLVVNLGSQRPERVQSRMAEIEKLVTQLSAHE